MVTHCFATNDKKREWGVVGAGCPPVTVTIASVLAGAAVGAAIKIKPSGEMTEKELEVLHNMTLIGSLVAVARVWYENDTLNGNYGNCWILGYVKMLSRIPI